MDDQTNNRLNFLVNDAYHRRQREIATDRIPGLSGELPANYVQPTGNWNSAASGENLVNAMAMIFASSNQNKAAAFEKLNEVVNACDTKIEQVRSAVTYAKIEFRSAENLDMVKEFEQLLEEMVIPLLSNFLAQYGKLMMKGKVAKADKYWNENSSVPGDLVRLYEKGGMLISLCDLNAESYKYFETNQKYLKLADWHEAAGNKDKNLLKAVEYLFNEINTFEDDLDLAISKVSDIHHDSIIDFTRVEKIFAGIQKDVNSLASQVK